MYTFIPQQSRFLSGLYNQLLLPAQLLLFIQVHQNSCICQLKQADSLFLTTQP